MNQIFISRDTVTCFEDGFIMAQFKRSNVSSFHQRSPGLRRPTSDNVVIWLLEIELKRILQSSPCNSPAGQVKQTIMISVVLVHRIGMIKPIMS